MVAKATNRLRHSVLQLRDTHGLTPANTVTAAAIVGLGVFDLLSRNPPLMAIQASVVASGPVAILNCSPAVTYAADKYYKLKAALRH